MILLWPHTAIAKNISFKASSTHQGKKVILKGEYKTPGNGKYPTVILLHGCGGLLSSVKNSLRNHARALNSNGFATLILDSFGPRNNGNGVVCQRTSSLRSAQAYRGRDVIDAIQHLKTITGSDQKSFFLMGQSNGASVASILAKSGRHAIRAVAAYYPWCGAVPANPAIPLLVMSGESDDWTPPDRCKKIDKPGGRLSVITYPDTHHSFDLNIPVQHYKGHTVGGNSAARSDARKRMIAFFKAALK